MTTIHSVDTVRVPAHPQTVAAGPKDVAKALALIVFWVAIVGSVVVPGVALLVSPPPVQTTVVPSGSSAR